jgi:hypothetical protein
MPFPEVYLILCDLENTNKRDALRTALNELGAIPVFASVWLAKQVPAPLSTAERIRDLLGGLLDVSTDSLVVIGIDSPVNIATFGDVTTFRKVFDFPVH